jgi:bifunctional non-homologous end joining protein LigD
MTLKEYHTKRDFKKTPEPSGQQTGEDHGALHFVVHKHRASHLHWDLRLELDGVLKSWAIPKGPSLDPQEKKLAMMVEDHPMDYQYFEGVIPEGNYGAGPVMIWDSGTYHAAGVSVRGQSEDTLRKGLQKGHISFILEGQKLKGEFALVKLKKGKENSWLLIKAKDPFATTDDPPDFDKSVSSGRTMDQIEGNLPDFHGINLSEAPEGAMPVGIRPMLATLVGEPFNRHGWLFEIKWDGYRCMAEIRKSGVHLYSRNGKRLDQVFAPLVASLQSLPFEALLDGEVVVVDEAGRANFQMLQSYLSSALGNLVYYVFDVLYLDGRDLKSLPLMRRKEILRQILRDTPFVKFSSHIETEGTSLFRAAVENGVEGIVAKDGKSPYRPGYRGREWLKVKTYERQEAVIAGFTEPRGGRKGFGSLVLGVYEDGRLRYIGNTGGGFTDQNLSSLRARLQVLAQPESSFEPPPKTDMEVTWVQPEIVCEVRFAEWTREGLMRHPVFLGLREDRHPTDVHRETPQPGPADKASDPLYLQKSQQSSRARKGELASINDAKVQLTNLDKVFWPEEGLTKGDMINYYRRIATFILPYLKDRPQSLHRFPDGINGEAFFQKNVDHHVPAWVRTTAVRSESERRETIFLLCQDEASLIYMANLGCIEINPWHSRIDHLESPDFMVLDLDPLDVSFHEVVRTAIATRNVLSEIGVSSFCKTSGATGLHIYVPLGAKYSYNQASQFAKLVNLLVHHRLPDTTSIERNPDRRRGKVYLDYLQNSRGQTLVAPYSLRPGKGAPVSTPLLWKELDSNLNPVIFNIRTIFTRLQQVGDLWKDVLGPGVDIDTSLTRLRDTIGD